MIMDYIGMIFDYILFVLAFLATIVGVISNPAKGSWGVFWTVSSVTIAGLTLLFAAFNFDEVATTANTRPETIVELTQSSAAIGRQLTTAQGSIDVLTLRLEEASRERTALQTVSSGLSIRLTAALSELREMAAPIITFSRPEIWHDCGSCIDEIIFTNMGGTISRVNEFDVRTYGVLSVGTGDYRQDSISCPFTPVPFSSPEGVNHWLEKTGAGGQDMSIKTDGSSLQETDAWVTLPVVLKACPDITAVPRYPIHNRHDLVGAAHDACGLLGISRHAWDEAQERMGAVIAAVTVAAILQTSEAIESPGGYLRTLARKREAGTFSLAPMLLARMKGSRGSES